MDDADDMTLPKVVGNARMGGPSRSDEVAVNVADFVLLCLKAVTHNVLFLRNVYPQNCFRLERVFGTSVQTCRFPEAARYISDVLEGVKDALLKGKVLAYCIAIHREGREPHEVFSIHPSVVPDLGTDVCWNDLEDVLRGVLIRSNGLLHVLPTPQPDAFFQIFVQTKAIGDLPTQAWARDGRPRPGAANLSQPAAAQPSERLDAVSDMSPVVTSAVCNAPEPNGNARGCLHAGSGQGHDAENALMFFDADDDLTARWPVGTVQRTRRAQSPVWSKAAKLHPVCDLSVPGVLDIALNVELMPG